MIDYGKIASSVTYYEKLGYTRLEAPWWVSEEINNITKPEGAIQYHIVENNKCLVASGEQSLLYMAVKGRLPKGKYQTVTPCFRHEPINKLHKKCFIKNELMITDKVSEKILDQIIFDALSFFRTQVPDPKLLDTLLTEEGLDILYRGKEIGSYGIRKCEFLEWVYGTGCAEPRLSRTISYSEIIR